ncbi:MAG: hypothetical protein ACREOO_13680 [bacterium]
MTRRKRGFGLVFWVLAILVIAVSVYAGTKSKEGEQAANTTPQIEHVPIAFGEQGQTIRIEADLFSPGRSLVYLRLYYKQASEASFRFVDLRRASRGYVGEIPGKFVQPPSIKYFLLALFSDQAIMSMPSRNPFGSPYEILITASKGPQPSPAKTAPAAPSPATGTQPATPPAGEPGAKPKPEPPEDISPQLLEKLRQLEGPMARRDSSAQDIASQAVTEAAEPQTPILILSPDPLSTVAPSEAVVAASFDPGVEIAPSSVRILLNGRDLTARAVVSAFLVSLNPGTLKPGEYRVSIQASDARRNSLTPATWRFTVSGEASEQKSEEQRRNAVASGVAYVDLHHEKFNGTSFDNNVLGGNLSGQYGQLHYDAAVYLTTLEDGNFQPRHRFTLSGGLPWLNVTLGDATPYLNELILWGRRVRGVQVGLQTGIVNLDFITGQTVRDVAPLLVGGVLQQTGTFGQSLWAVRPSFGGKSFQIGLILMKAQDDTNSIQVNTAGVTPRGNLVAGADMSMSFSRSRVQIKAAVAQSLVSNNISLPVLTKSTLDSLYNVDLPFDPAKLSNLIIINESLSPLDPSGGTGLAYQIGAQLNFFSHFMNFGFKQIGSQYNSFGYTFLRNDLRGFYLNDNWRMLQNRLFFTLGFERYRDHFNPFDGDPSTALNSVQFGFAVNWSPEWPSLNFNFRNHNRNNSISDTTQVLTPNGSVIVLDRREDNRTRDFSVQLNQDVRALNLQHTISLGVTNSSRVDRFAGQRLPVAAGDVVSNLQSVSVRTRFNVPLITTVMFSTNSNRAVGLQSPFKYSALNAQAEYRFPKPQVRTYAGVRYVGASGSTGVNSVVSSIISYNQIGVQAGGGILIANQHDIVLDFGVLGYNDKGGNLALPGQPATLVRNPSFTNAFMRAHYEFRF